MSTIASDATTRSVSPVGVRLSAASSALGSASPAVTSARAFAAGFADSTNARRSATVARAQSASAAITQPSHSWKSSRRMVSQIPNAIAATSPKAVAAAPTIATRLRPSVAAGVSAERSGTTTIQDMTSEPTSVAAPSR